MEITRHDPFGLGPIPEPATEPEEAEDPPAAEPGAADTRIGYV